MAKSITTEMALEKFKNKYGDSYIYPKDWKYVSAKTPIEIVCKKHGQFTQSYDVHIRGASVGCPKCGRDQTSKLQSLGKERFIQRAKEKHGNKYDYSKVDYVNNHTKVIILCPIHGEFEQIPSNHLKYECNACGNLAISNSRKSTKEEFLKKSNELHKDSYDYSLVEYISSSTKVAITCKNCNKTFLQTPNKHLSGEGCPNCFGTKKHTQESFLLEVKRLVDEDFLYDRAVYVNAKTKIEVGCKAHGYFSTTPNNLLRGRGCPKCFQEKSDSKGVRRIESILLREAVTYEREVTLPDLRLQKPLRFDFCIMCGENISGVIEYDGPQHYNPKAQWKSGDFEIIQTRDRIKNKYCTDNNIPLLRIRYDERKSEESKILLFLESIREVCPFP